MKIVEMLEIGDLVMMPADQYEDAQYGIVTGYDDTLVIVEWFDGEKSRELPHIDRYSHLKKVQNGKTTRLHR